MIKDTLETYIKWAYVSFHSSFCKRSVDNSGNRLFLIASHLPPNSGGGVFRPLSFIENAEENGWDCIAYTIDNISIENKSGQYLLSKIKKNIINRVKCNKSNASWRFSPRIDGGFNNALNIYESAVKYNDSPSVILCTGPSFCTFLTGLYLKKFFQAKLVLDYRDEWSLCPFSWVDNTQLNSYFERKCCEQADKIIFTTKSHLEHHTKTFSHIDPNKRIIIPNGYEEADVPAANYECSNEKYTISFLGYLGSHSLPNNFLVDLEYIIDKNPSLENKISIVFIGNKCEQAINAFNDFPYKRVIRSYDHVSKQDAMKMMKQSNALLILAGDNMEGYIPGKLFDYLACKKPIIYYGVNGEASQIINYLESGICVLPKDFNSLFDGINALINGGFNISNFKVQNWLKSHTRKELAKLFYNELNQLVDEK